MKRKNVSIKEMVAAGKFKKEKEYWLNKLSGELEKSAFPPSYEGHEKEINPQDSTTNSIRFQFAAPQTELLLKLSNNSDYRLHMILAAILLLVIKRYTGSSDLIIATPIYKQETHAEYINTILPLRNNLDGKFTVKELLVQVRNTLTEASENQNFPMDTLLYHLGIHNADSNADSNFPLSDIIMQLENIQDRQYISHIKTNMFFSFSRDESGISGTVEYNAAMYGESYLQRLIAHLLKAAEESLGNINKSIKDIEILTPEEKKQQLSGFSGPTQPYPEDKLIHQLFQQQVERTPDDTAVVETDLAHYVTYRHLNARANQLARKLKESGVRPGQIVAVMVSPSNERIQAMMAVLKAGAAYLPIDPAYPGERNKYMLRECNVTTIIIEQNSTYRNDPLIADSAVKTLAVEDEKNYSGDTANLELSNTPDDLAYVLYTSGTTGKPKGVMVKHRNVNNTIQWFGRSFGVKRGTRIMGLTDYTFDPSVEDIFGALLYGGTIYPVNNEIIAFPQDFCNYVDCHQLNLVDYIPTVLNRLLSHRNKLQSLEVVIVGGEKLETSIKDRLLEKGYSVYNNYGPTEVTVDALYSRCSQNPVTLGKPLPNTRCYILDKDNNLMPLGIPGELCVAGAGIAHGYINNRRQTEEKFNPDPFVTGERMYRTGDRARWLSNGEIDFLGRQDHQVKLRGRRIELEEIESALKMNSLIENAAVIIKERPQIDSKGDKTVTSSQLDDTNALWNMLREKPDREIQQYLLEIENTSPQQLDTPQSKPPKKKQADQTVTTRTKDFKIELGIYNSKFLLPPQANQRNWVIQRSLEEMKDDLLHMDKLTKRFVAGSQRERIKREKDWKESEAQYDSSQLIIEGQQVMQDWERPLMKKMAEIATEAHGDVLEVGFGMAISATFMVEMGVKSYSVIECNEGVMEHFRDWQKKYPQVETNLIKGKWQDVEDQLGMYDAIFFDTYPLEEDEFLQYVINNITFAEHFFPTAARHLRKGGVFTYYSNEIDTFSRRHQRLVFDYFERFELSIVKDMAPPPDCNYWWADSMVAIKAVK